MAFRHALWLRVLLLLLVVEFALGIWLVRYGTFPNTTNVVKAAMFRGDPVLTAHMALAVLLVVLAFVEMVAAFGSSAPPRLRWFALGGFLALLVAYESGVEFILSGFSNNAYPLVMLAAFFAAALFLGLGQWQLARPALPPPPPAPSTGSP